MARYVARVPSALRVAGCRHPLLAILLPFGVVLIGGPILASPAFIVLPFIFLLLLVAKAASSTRVEIAADGIVIDDRFLAYRDIVSVEKIEETTRINFTDRNAIRLHGVRIIARDEVVDLVATIRQSSTPAWPAEARALLTAIEKRRAIAPKGSNVGELVGREGRNAKQWLTGLRSLALGDGAYRSSTVSRDDLWEAVEDPAAAPPVRVGAAIALRPHTSPEDQARLRIVLDDTATPEVRNVLAAVLDDADENFLENLLSSVR